MKKLIFSLLCCAGFLLSAAPNKACEDFSVAPAAASVKAGTVLEPKVSVLCKDGYQLKAVSLFVHRKSAPKTFFEQKGLPINWFNKKELGKASPYDSIYAASLTLKDAVAKGTVPLKLDTTGMTPGDYAFAVQGYFVKPKEKSVYASVWYCVTITEGGAGVFKATPQTK